MPVLVHTGGHPRSYAGRYYNICEEFPDVKVILAHARPLRGALKILKELPNVFADTAFLPVEDGEQIISKVGMDKLIFGTDFPIQKHFFREKSLIDIYKEELMRFPNLQVVDPLQKLNLNR